MPISLIKDLLFKKDKVNETGKLILIGFIFSVILDHFGVINLNKISIPYAVDALYVYLGLNASGVGIFIYFEKKSRIAVGKFCLQCGSELELSPKYKCPKCGEYKIGQT